jgi:hypothetical protein
MVTPLEHPGGPPAPPTAALPSGGLLRPTIRHLYEAHIVPRLTAGAARPDTPTFLDGWAAQRVMDAALESASGGCWVEVDLTPNRPPVAPAPATRRGERSEPQGDFAEGEGAPLA